MSSNFCKNLVIGARECSEVRTPSPERPLFTRFVAEGQRAAHCLKRGVVLLSAFARTQTYQALAFQRALNVTVNES
jgi:hypothetical protein